LLEACSLGNDGRVYLVEVAGKVYALLSGARGTQVIDEVEAPGLLAELRRGEGVRGGGVALPGLLMASLSSGLSWWRRLTERQGAMNRAGDEEANRTVELLQAQLARVRRMGRAGDEALAVGKR
jgi:hypothetical protein